MVRSRVKALSRGSLSHISSFPRFSSCPRDHSEPLQTNPAKSELRIIHRPVPPPEGVRKVYGRSWKVVEGAGRCWKVAQMRPNRSKHDPIGPNRTNFYFDQF